ncbi:recombinase family protein [Nonomuraea sp. NPDC046802]|uniref:recombinase family protein n=1 Tax=Nonomuraea sp. NPDC046802 TaxID=3154919 RepID=UPI0033D06767
MTEIDWLVHAPSRLSRSVLHLVTLGADLCEPGVGLPVIEQGTDTGTMEGRAMFGMLSVLSELQPPEKTLDRA